MVRKTTEQLYRWQHAVKLPKPVQKLSLKEGEKTRRSREGGDILALALDKHGTGLSDLIIIKHNRGGLNMLSS